MKKPYYYIAELSFGQDHTEPSYKGEIQYCCPFCESVRGKKDKSYKLYVNINSGKYHCFKCNTNGRLRLSDEVVSYVKTNNLDRLSVKKESAKSDYPYVLPTTKASDNPNALNYLIRRGYSKEIADFYNIRYASIIDSLYPGRIVVPNIVKGGFTDMLVARSIDPNIDKRWKYLNPSGSDKRNIVFNLHRNINSDKLIITEGVFSAMSCGVNGVATYGKLVSNEQISQIVKSKPKEVYVMLDFDAQNESFNLAKTLSRYLPNSKVYYVELLDNRDPNDLGYSGVMNAIRTQSRLINNTNNRLKI